MGAPPQEPPAAVSSLCDATLPSQSCSKAESGGCTAGGLEVPVHLALVASRPGVHVELLELLQGKIVSPLIQKKLLSGFRVLTITPPSFVAQASTCIVFELLVPSPWPITESDVQQWRRRLGTGVKLVLSPSFAPPASDSWDARRARSVMARAMVMPLSIRAGSQRRRPRAGPCITSCMDRSDCLRAPLSEKSDSPRCQGNQQPVLNFIDESTKRRVKVADGASVLTPAMAAELCQHLPVSLRWKTSWRLAYSPRLHGVSLQTLYRRMSREGPSLLFVQDHAGLVFGGFATAEWHATDRYFGSGESFVFRFSHPWPKPDLPLLHEAQGFDESHGAERRTRDNDLLPKEQDETEAKINQALEVLGHWHPKVRAEAERAFRAAQDAGHITSPTEALDELLSKANAGPSPLSSSFAGESGLTFEGSTKEESGHNEEELGHLEQLGEEDEEDFEGEPQEDDEEPLGYSQPGDTDLGLEVFHWSLKDPFFLFSDLECLAMGGGSAMALYVEKDLLHGMSEPCSTFGSKCLASADRFIISGLECWVFDDP